MHSDLWPLIHVFLDWDGTITKKDTLEVVAKIGYDKNPTSRPWNDIVKAYLDDYRAHQDAYTPSKDQRTTIKEESAWLESLSKVESRSINRVREAGVFEGVHKNNVLDAAIRAIESRSVQLRHGWTDLFFSDPSQPGDPHPIMGREGFRFHILSVNWSATFIKGCLLHAAILEQPKVASKALMSMTHLANEIAIDERPPCSVDQEKITIQTSADKLRILKKSVHGSVGSPQRNSKKTVTVYVGDSATDFDALLHVDVGICVRDEPLGSGQMELAETLGRVGVLVKPLSELEISLSGQETTSKDLWWTNDLQEVSSALEKILAAVKDYD
jgi:2-hydroxy-3-keto-5-methylthiopentenyl-1-phosphate phosphatase